MNFDNMNMHPGRRNDSRDDSGVLAKLEFETQEVLFCAPVMVAANAITFMPWQYESAFSIL
ncbi:MAG TPA: hypothetical protein V6C76_13280 [Drouetiella sp.]